MNRLHPTARSLIPHTTKDMERAARDLLAMGKCGAVLVKGGHALEREGEGEAGAVAQDYLLDGESGQGTWISSPRCVRLLG